MRISLSSRGRAVPIVWQVLQHPSRSVASTVYADVLAMAASLLPLHCKVSFLADRGFADPHLMVHLKRFDWPWRMCFKRSFWSYRGGHRPCKTNRLSLALGEARFWHHVYITKVRYGPVHLALARRKDAKAEWCVVSDGPTDVPTFAEYGLRCELEENCLDDTGIYPTISL